jgi:hypothetical protein
MQQSFCHHTSCNTAATKSTTHTGNRMSSTGIECSLTYAGNRAIMLQAAKLEAAKGCSLKRAQKIVGNVASRLRKLKISCADDLKLSQQCDHYIDKCSKATTATSQKSATTQCRCSHDDIDNSTMQAAKPCQWASNNMTSLVIACFMLIVCNLHISS